MYLYSCLAYNIYNHIPQNLKLQKQNQIKLGWVGAYGRLYIICGCPGSAINIHIPGTSAKKVGYLQNPVTQLTGDTQTYSLHWPTHREASISKTFAKIWLFAFHKDNTHANRLSGNVNHKVLVMKIFRFFSAWIPLWPVITEYLAETLKHLVSFPYSSSWCSFILFIARTPKAFIVYSVTSANLSPL